VNSILKQEKGLSLIELMVVLVLSTLLTAALYRTFVSQQKVYKTQEQVVEMQQNLRGGISRMMGEIRMAGFGHVSMVLPVNLNGNTFNHVLNLNTPVAGALTFLTSVTTPARLESAGGTGQNQIVVSTLTDGQGSNLFDTGDRRYISIGGLESYRITSIDQGTKTLTLSGALTYNHPAGTPIFAVRAITYQVTNLNGIPTLLRNENLGEEDQPQADYIERLQFSYFDGDGNPTVNPLNIRLIRVNLTARTDNPDPELANVGDGFRRRQIVTNIHLRNMGL